MMLNININMKTQEIPRSCFRHVKYVKTDGIQVMAIKMLAIDHLSRGVVSDDGSSDSLSSTADEIKQMCDIH